MSVVVVKALAILLVLVAFYFLPTGSWLLSGEPRGTIGSIVLLLGVIWLSGRLVDLIMPDEWK